MVNSGVPMGPHRITWAESPTLSTGPEEAHSWFDFQKSPADSNFFKNTFLFLMFSSLFFPTRIDR